MYILLVVVALTFFNNAKFADGDKGSLECRNALARKAFNDVAHEKRFDAVRKEYKHYLDTGEMTPSLTLVAATPPIGNP